MTFRNVLLFVIIGLAVFLGAVLFSRSSRPQSRKPSDSSPPPTSLQVEALSWDGNAATTMMGDATTVASLPTEDQVSRMLMETEIARKYRIPGRFKCFPGAGVSKVLFPRDLLSPLPEKESDPGLLLCLDNATGNVVAAPSESWVPLPEGEIVDIAMSDIEDAGTKNYYKSMKKEIVQVPGLSVVTFRGEPPSEAEGGYLLAPAFILRVWVNTRTRTVYCGEVGN